MGAPLWWLWWRPEVWSLFQQRKGTKVLIGGGFQVFSLIPLPCERHTEKEGQSGFPGLCPSITVKNRSLGELSLYREIRLCYKPGRQALGAHIHIFMISNFIIK